MVLHFLDAPTLSLDGVLDVNLGDLVDFFQDPTNCEACTPRQRKQFEGAIHLSPHIEACRCR